MNGLIKMEDSVYCDPQTGEEYFSVGPDDWHFLGQNRKENTVRQLKKTIESLVLVRLGEDWQIPSISITEYFGRLKAYKSDYLKVGGSYSEFCETIALEALAKSMYVISEGKCVVDIAKIISHYKNQIIKTVDDLIEYKTLQRIRLRSNRDELTQYLQKAFFESVTTFSHFKHEIEVEKLESELSLCLTNEEKVDFLKSDYKNRLIAYKENAQRSTIGKSAFLEHPWQRFITQHIERSCSDYISSSVYWLKDDIEFDLNVVNRWTNRTIQFETGALASEWLTIEWIKNKVQTNLSENPTAATAPPRPKNTISPANHTITNSLVKPANPEQSFKDIFVNPVEFEFCLSRLLENDGQYVLLNVNGEWIGRKNSISVLVAWIDQLIYYNKIHKNVPRGRLAQLLNGYFKGINMGMEGRMLSNTNETINKYKAHFRAMLLP